MRILRSAQKAWRGEEKLWVVFWGWFVGLDFILLSAVIAPFGHTAVTPWTSFEIAITALLMAIYLWQIFVVTRCAKNHKSVLIRLTSQVFLMLGTWVMLGHTLLNSD